VFIGLDVVTTRLWPFCLVAGQVEVCFDILFQGFDIYIDIADEIVLME